MLAHELIAARAEKATQDERHDEDVVELAGDRNEVGNEVERQREIADERGQEQLAPTRHSRVGDEPGDEDDAIGYESGQGASVLPSPEDQKRNNESYPDESDQAEREREPQPPGHRLQFHRRGSTRKTEA